MKKILCFIVLFLIITETACSSKTGKNNKQLNCVLDNAEVCEAVNVDCEISEFGTEQGKSLYLRPHGDEISGVWISSPALENFDEHTKAHIEFYLYIDGDSFGYGDVEVVNNENLTVDSGLPKGKWNRINFDATVYRRNGRQCVFIGLINGAGEKVYISGLTVSDDVYSVENCFGGDILWQLEPARTQLEAYVWVTEGGKVIVIDGGDDVDADRLLKLIRTYKNEVDGWFISHFHSDHTGALIKILTDEEIQIKNLYFDYDTEEDFQSYDGEFTYINKLRQAIEKNRRKVGNVIGTSRGDEFMFDRLKFKVLNDAYFGAENVGNNSSVVFKAETAGKSVLFLGDLASYGDVLLEDEYFITEAMGCEIVQMAHHGQNGVSDRFYNSLKNIKVCLYPAPKWLFNCDALGQGINSSPEYKSLHTRELMREKGVRYTFSSAKGRVKLG